MFLDEGAIIAILSIMVITSLFSFLKKKTGWKWIPKGFWSALIIGCIVMLIGKKYNIFITSLKESLWDYLASWIIITGLAGYGHIAGKKLIGYVKAFLLKGKDQIKEIETEEDKYKKKLEELEKKIKELENSK